MNRKITTLLQSIEISNSFARNFRHGIETNEGWDLFEPTRFVYAFFAFNMLYENDWAFTLNLGRIQKLKQTGITKAKPQIKKLVEFINKTDDTAFEKALDKIDSKRELFKVFENIEEDVNSNKPSHLSDSKTIMQAFRYSTEKYSLGIKLSIEDHFNLLEMSYAVRNNLFHGEKKAHKMMEQGHRNRLFHYGNIILATNEGFFDAIKHHHKYRRVDRDEIHDNL